MDMMKPLPELFLLLAWPSSLKRSVFATRFANTGRFCHCERSEAIHIYASRDMDCLVAFLPPMTPGPTLPPRKDRLLQFRDAGVSAGQHFGKLIDQRRRRRMDMLTGMAKADHAPR